MNPQLSESSEPQSSCLFCKGHHDSDHCRTYPTACSRQQRLKEQNRCNRCLNYGHMANCANATLCRFCNKSSHHELVCNLNAKNEDWCKFCDTHFNTNECQIWDTHSKRAKILMTRNLCKMCLLRHSSQRSCSRYTLCDYCLKESHHKVMCRQNPFLKENQDHDMSHKVCIFCRQHADPGVCSIITDLNLRLKQIVTEGRCKKCMRFHPTECCFYRNRCKVCSSPEHHDVICPNDKMIEMFGAMGSQDDSFDDRVKNPPPMLDRWGPSVVDDFRRI